MNDVMLKKYPDTTGLSVVQVGCLAALLIFGTRVAGATDSVNVKGDNTSMVGDVTGFTKTELKLKRGQRDESIPANQVLRVRWDGEPAALNAARNAEDRGLLDRALEGYTSAAQTVKPDQVNLKTDLEFLIARVTARQAESDAAKVPDAVAKLEAFVKQYGDHFRYYEAVRQLANLQLSQNNEAAAEAQFAIIEQAPWSDYKMAAKNAAANFRLKRDDAAGALALYQEVAAMPAPSPVEQAEQREAIIGTAACMARQQKFDEALKILQEQLDKAPLDDMAVRANLYVRLGECYTAMGQQRKAVRAYLHVDLLYPENESLHAEALYHLSQLWGGLGKPDRAADAAAQLQQKYPKNPWSAKATN